MELSERKYKILETIIKTYLETGEPVGSRTISKFADLNLSSATIRNEMADLEEMGYIVQPHTSAGRIPSDKGYRLYVDNMMKDKKQEVTDMRNDLIQKADKLEILLQQVARLLATNTNYTSMVTKPHFNRHVLKFVQISDFDETKILLVIVLEGNIVKNRIINCSKKISKEEVLKMNVVFNTFLQGLGLETINMSVIKDIREQLKDSADIVNIIMDEIAEAIEEEQQPEIYTSGATNILKYPELSDNEKASELLYTIEEKKMLSEIINDKLDVEDNRGIQVYIGNETPVESMKDCSVVTATYELQEGVYGKVGIIGPKRMDYEKVVKTLKNFMSQLDEIFKDNNNE